jgi:hypothetical protein
MTAIQRVLTALAAAGSAPRGTAAGRWLAHCSAPDHPDEHPSMTVTLGTGTVLLCCRSRGCELDAIVAGIGLNLADLFDEPLEQKAAPDTWVPCGHRRIEEYRYSDERDALLYGVTRCDQKHFAQWRPDPTRKHGRRWSLRDDTGNLAVRLVPYRLPTLAAMTGDVTVAWVAEGERDVHALEAHGAIATCNSGGAGKWQPEFADHFHGLDIIVVADKDEPGRRHAELVTTNLLPVVNSLEIVVALHGKDARDHFNGGGHLGNFRQVAEPKTWEPDAELAALLAADR